jgi:hypothetical protein
MKPGDFPIGSPESRAAARALLEARETPAMTLLITSYIERPGLDPDLYHVRPRQRGGAQIIHMLDKMQWPPDDPSKVCWDCHCEEIFRAEQKQG